MKTFETSFRFLSFVLPLSVVTLVGCGGVDEPEPETLAECLSGEWNNTYSLVNHYDGTTDYFHGTYQFNDDGTVELTTHADVTNWDDLFVDNYMPLIDQMAWIGDVFELYGELTGGADPYTYTEGSWLVDDNDLLTLTMSDRPGSSRYGYTYAKWDYLQQESSTSTTTTRQVHCTGGKLVLSALTSDHDDDINGLWQNNFTDVTVSRETNSVLSQHLDESDKRAYELQYTSAGYEMAACYGGKYERPTRNYDKSLVHIDLAGDTPVVTETGLKHVSSPQVRNGYIHYLTRENYSYFSHRYRLDDGFIESIELPGYPTPPVVSYSSGIGYSYRDPTDSSQDNLLLFRDDGTTSQISSIIDVDVQYSNAILSLNPDGQAIITDLATMESELFFAGGGNDVRTFRWEGPGFNGQKYFLVDNDSLGVRELWIQHQGGVRLITTMDGYGTIAGGFKDFFPLDEGALVYLSRNGLDLDILTVVDIETGNKTTYQPQWPERTRSLNFIHRGPDRDSLYLQIGSGASPLWQMNADSSLSKVLPADADITEASNREAYLASDHGIYFMDRAGALERLSQYDEYAPVSVDFRAGVLYFKASDDRFAKIKANGDVVLLDERIAGAADRKWNLGDYVGVMVDSDLNGAEYAFYDEANNQLHVTDLLTLYGMSSESTLLGKNAEAIMVEAYTRNEVCDGPFEPLVMEDGKLWYEGNYLPLYYQTVFER